MKNKRGFAHIEIIVVILLIAIVGAVVFWVSRNGGEQLVSQSTSTPEAMAEEDTSDWVTYSGDGYSFKYPPTWEDKGTQQVDVSYVANLAPIQHDWPEHIPDNYPAITIYYLDNPDSLSVPDFQNYLSKQETLRVIYVESSVEKMFGSNKGHYSENSSCGPVICDRYVLAHQEKVFVFENNYPIEVDGNQRKIFNQILSTFEFVDSSSNVEWSTYTNAQYGYSINYPEGWRTQEGDSFVGFGPQEIREDTLWGVVVYDLSETTRENVVNGFGSQFEDRKQEKENASLAGVSATKIITTTPEISDWYSVYVLVENDGYLYSISNGAINDENLANFDGVPKGVKFEDFYKTFKLNE